MENNRVSSPVRDRHSAGSNSDEPSSPSGSRRSKRFPHNDNSPNKSNRSDDNLHTDSAPSRDHNAASKSDPSLTSSLNEMSYPTPVKNNNARFDSSKNYNTDSTADGSADSAAGSKRTSSPSSLQTPYQASSGSSQPSTPAKAQGNASCQSNDTPRQNSQAAAPREDHGKGKAPAGVQQQTPYDKKRDEFLRELYTFMENHGQAITKMPSLGYQELDLYRLYLIVVARGGMDEVTRRQEWKSVYQELGIPTMSTSASYNTRTNYKKYLYRYELEHCDFPDRARPIGHEPKYAVGQYIRIVSSTFEGQVFYANILKYRYRNGINVYYVHYNNWSNSHDEWMPESVLDPLLPEEQDNPETLLNPPPTRSSKSNHIIFDPLLSEKSQHQGRVSKFIKAIKKADPGGNNVSSGGEEYGSSSSAVMQAGYERAFTSSLSPSSSPIHMAGGDYGNAMASASRSKAYAKGANAAMASGTAAVPSSSASLLSSSPYQVKGQGGATTTTTNGSVVSSSWYSDGSSPLATAPSAPTARRPATNADIENLESLLLMHFQAGRGAAGGAAFPSHYPEAGGDHIGEAGGKIVRNYAPWIEQKFVPPPPSAAASIVLAQKGRIRKFNVHTQELLEPTVGFRPEMLTEYKMPKVIADHMLPNSHENNNPLGGNVPNPKEAAAIVEASSSPEMHPPSSKRTRSGGNGGITLPNTPEATPAKQTPIKSAVDPKYRGPYDRPVALMEVTVKQLDEQMEHIKHEYMRKTRLIKRLYGLSALKSIKLSANCSIINDCKVVPVGSNLEGNGSASGNNTIPSKRQLVIANVSASASSAALTNSKNSSAASLSSNDGTITGSTRRGYTARSTRQK